MAGEEMRRIYRWRRSIDALDVVVIDGTGAPRDLREGSDLIASEDGRCLVFSTRSALDARQTTIEFSTFIVDMQSTPRRYELLSVSSAGSVARQALSSVCGGGDIAGGGANAAPIDLSPDGRFVLMSTNGYGLTPDDSSGDSCADAFVAERGVSNLRRVQARTPPNDHSVRGRWIDRTGQFVTVQTERRIDTTDANDVEDVYLGRVDGVGAWQLISVPRLPSLQNDDDSWNAVPVPGMRRVVFTSRASTLVEGDTNFAADVFLRDLDRGTTTRLTVDEHGRQLEYGCTNAASCSMRDGSFALSADGQVLAFNTPAAVMAVDGNAVYDVYLRAIR